MTDRIDLGLRDIRGGETPASTPLPDDAVVQHVGVTGMTCAHCVRSVTEEISEIAGVRGVSVDLHVGDVSRVTIASTTPLDTALVRDAVEEAGYSLADVPA
ncbi:heavy metal-associated domain-containing protein [Microbacterium sp. 5K110]|jgi:copper chaperone CopZ|uniref:heavy-metal-associated domain-containing protein n=1 Tax=unclassified Microbacterium TaxID=2609290 RepID=UPI0010FDD8B7|nr:heavy metal-associated domain-containing protein [Microbacterium sp. 5K110]TLF29772.1 heavy-metal-associated domain-containing protein [Microbacterium sp. 5K110]